MRDWEKATWASGQTGAEVIRRVGEALGRRALEMTTPNDLILLLAGKGHNGDDVRAAQPHLPNRRVELLNVDDPAAAREKFQKNAGAYALVIDGLFGIGLDRPLDEAWQSLINTINSSGVPVLAADVPSGLNADTGEPFGAAIRARVTLTVGAPKEGMLETKAAEFVGRLEVAGKVGLLPCSLPSEMHWTCAGDFKGFPPARPVIGHKGTFGHLGIVAGSMGFHGAGVLTARGAQRARPGLITLFAHESAYYPMAVQLQSTMVHSWNANTDLINLLEKYTAILIGPGLAAPDLPDEIKTPVRRFWREFPSPMIVDASALDWLAQGNIVEDAVRVMTPHPGEAAHLLRTTAEKIQAHRPEAVRELSRRYGNCWVVLKGHQTLVGRSTGEIFVNSSGNPHLAQGGSGDVLAGYLAGMLAQPPLLQDNSKTIRYAVWQHGAAADWLDKNWPNWIIEDLLQQLGAIGEAT